MRAGGWRTYAAPPGFDAPWSLLLPPGYAATKGRPLEEIAAFQWDSANRIALADLQRLPAARWISVRYEDLVADPRHTIERLCAFLGVGIDPRLDARLSIPLPPARHTLTPPARDKWRRNEAEVTRVLPLVEHTWDLLRSLAPRVD